MNIALLGFGTVGSHFYKLCEGRTDLHVAAVLSRRPRLELTCTVTADYDEIVRDPSIDIVVEVMGGIEPAYSYLCAAMRAGKHVVTANKQLMCAHFEELTSLAKEKGVALRCTAAAGGGIPWLTSLSRASQLDEITAVEGILNGTTNYMLSAMTNSGADYAAALQKAQELGYAEADPTADVEGLDARRKLVLSADLAFGVNIREEDIPCVGISSITAGDIAKAKDEGLTYAQDRGRQYGVVGFLVLFLVIMIYNMVRGLDNSLPLTLFWAYLSCEAAGRYFARKEKSVLATAVLAGLASLFSLVSYILETLP